MWCCYCLYMICVMCCCLYMICVMLLLSVYDMCDVLLSVYDVCDVMLSVHDVYDVMLCLWPGSAVLVLTTTEVDKTGASYYGEQGLHYLSAKGEGNIVILGVYHTM